MALVTFDPTASLMHLQNELDRFFGKPSFDLGLSGPDVFPAVNVFTDQDGLVIRAEVPGIRPDDLTVQFEAGRLTVAGERREPEAGEGSYARRECRYGRFSRVVQLPRDLDPDKASAEVRNGVLTIRIPKHAASKPRQIEVRAA